MSSGSWVSTDPNQTNPATGPTPGHGVTARMVTTDGWAVPHAVLTVTDMSGQQVARALTDTDGMAATPSLPAGTYTAIVTAAGYAPIARTAIVTATEPARLGVITLSSLDGPELPPAGPWTIDPAHSTVEATARHLGLSSVKGRFTEFSGSIEIAEPIENSSVHAVIQADSIDTANAMRDEHLRSADFLGVAQHPTIEFHSTRLTRLGTDRWTLDGKLTLNGVTESVPLDLTYLGTGSDPWGGTRAAFRASTELHREQFAITYNQLVRAGIAAIGATVRVELNIQAVQGDSLPTA